MCLRMSHLSLSFFDLRCLKSADAEFAFLVASDVRFVTAICFAKAEHSQTWTLAEIK